MSAENETWALKPQAAPAEQEQPRNTNGNNRLSVNDRAAHDWYRFVLSYPPHLVREYIQRFQVNEESCVLDPFCGTGTTVVECKKLGIPSIGLEPNRMAQFASSVKVNWQVDPDGLIEHVHSIAGRAEEWLKDTGIEDIPILFGPDNKHRDNLRTLQSEQMRLILTDSISPLPLHKTLILLDSIESYRDGRYYEHERLALAKAVVFSISNLRFGPEVGIGKPKHDTPVINTWLSTVQTIASDLRELQKLKAAPAVVHNIDARQPELVLHPNSISSVITSPPYPNEKDYTRTTRLEMVLLGFIKTKQDLQALKRTLLRSNTRNVYKGDTDYQWATGYPEIQRLAERIEERRIELGKTSGFEKLYGTVTKLYFGGMARHLAAMRPLLRPGAHLAYVVGDQASYLQVMIRTGQLIADIARALGYEVEGIDLFRTRLATATKEQLREEVVVLRWKGRNTQTFISRDLKMPSKKRRDESGVENEIGEPLSLLPLDEPAKSTVEEKLREYDHVIERVFREAYEIDPTAASLPITLRGIEKAVADLGLVISNKPDIAYTYRTGRRALPQSILNHGNWAIEGAGKGKYNFVRLNRSPYMDIPKDIKITRILDSTPQLVLKYQGRDEQSLLAAIRYNRLVDTFTSLTTYHLQGHFRSTVKGIGQIEIDDLYIGINTDGEGFIIPIEAKSESPHDQLGVVQITQMIRFAREKFPDLKVRPLGIKMFEGSFIFLEFNNTIDVDLVATERYKRYELYREK